MSNSTRKPYYSFRVDIDVPIWEEMDRISRTKAATKREMTEEGVKLWLSQYYKTTGDKPPEGHKEQTA